jgi:hypothetical protein
VVAVVLRYLDEVIRQRQTTEGPLAGPSPSR